MTQSGKVLLYLQGVYFPATKEKIINYVKFNDAPEDIVLILENLKKVEYETESELIRELEIEGYSESP